MAPVGVESGTRPGVLGAVGLATEYADEVILGTVRDVHDAVSGRVHDVLDAVGSGFGVGAATGIPGRVHRGIAKGVFTGLGLGLRGAARGLTLADDLALRTGRGVSLEDTPRGRFVVSAVNGLIGDRLFDERPQHSFDLGVRRHGRDVPLDSAGLLAAYPDASDALVVFVHGMSETEEYWQRRALESGGSYGARLRDEQGWTPVYLRVNTGLPVTRNGAAMAGVLQQVVDHWPLGVRRVALVGHSMGGLIIRCACVVRTEAVATSGHSWTELVTDIVTLGTPHHGAPLARVIEVGAQALAKLPESAPFGKILDHRAAGVHDLVRGLDDSVAPLPNARYHLVGATLNSSLRNPAAEALGDLLVGWSSATATRKGRGLFADADVLHVPGADHFDLLNDERVYVALRGWLSDHGARRSA